LIRKLASRDGASRRFVGNPQVESRCLDVKDFVRFLNSKESKLKLAINTEKLGILLSNGMNIKACGLLVEHSTAFTKLRRLEVGVSRIWGQKNDYRSNLVENINALFVNARECY